VQKNIPSDMDNMVSFAKNVIQAILQTTLISDNEYFKKEVINRKGNGTKNYVLIFNFEGDGFKEITYVAIDVTNVWFYGCTF